MKWIKISISSALMLLSCQLTAQAKENTPNFNVEFRQNGRWGVIDRLGKVVVEPKFDDIYLRPDGTIEAKNGSSKFYYDEKGRALLEFDPYKPTVFDEDGLAAYWINGKYGLINRSGEWIIKPTLGYVHRFGPSMQYVVHYNGGVGVIDIRNNRWIIPNDFQYIEKLSNSGLAVAKKKGLYGYIDKTGNWALNPGKFESLSSFDQDGFAIVKENSKCGVIDTKFEWVIKPISEEAYCFSRFDEFGHLKYTSGGKIGLLNKQGKVVVAAKYDLIASPRMGLYSVKLNNKWGFIDTEGKVKIPLKFDSATSFDEFGTATVDLARKRHLIDTNGKMSLIGNADDVGYFGTKNWTEAKSNGKWGVIDRKGRWVIAPKYECLGYCRGEKPPPVMVLPPRLYFRPDVE